MGKFEIFDENQGLMPLEKSELFNFFKFLFNSLESFLSFLECRQTHFPGLFDLP